MADAATDLNRSERRARTRVATRASILEAARRLAVSASECIYVGDSPHDMAAGIAAGALTAAAMWGPFPVRVLEPDPNFALAHLGDLAGLLGGDVERFAV